MIEETPQDDAPNSADSLSTTPGTQTTAHNTPASSNTTLASGEGLSGNPSKNSKRTIIWNGAFKTPESGDIKNYHHDDGQISRTDI